MVNDEAPAGWTLANETTYRNDRSGDEIRLYERMWPQSPGNTHAAYYHADTGMILIIGEDTADDPVLGEVNELMATHPRGIRGDRVDVIAALD